MLAKAVCYMNKYFPLPQIVVHSFYARLNLILGMCPHSVSPGILDGGCYFYEAALRSFLVFVLMCREALILAAVTPPLYSAAVFTSVDLAGGSSERHC